MTDEALPGYEARRPELLAVRAMLARRGPGARALLVEGPPGAGKSYLAESLARGLDAPLVVHLCHGWTDADELFCGVDVGAAVAGDSEHVRQDGVLARVARLAEHHERVVLLLDELDKAPERAENLLLDWLQSGRVPVAPGIQLETRMERVIVIATSNGQRAPSDALLRRVRRLQMAPLRAEVRDRVSARLAGCSERLASILGRAARPIAEADGAHLSPQEVALMARELLDAGEGPDDVRLALEGWAARGEPGRQRVRAMSDGLVAGLWGAVLEEPR